MTRGAEGLGHALVRAGEHVAAGAHGAADQHGLPRQLVVHRDQRVVRGERARRTLGEGIFDYTKLHTLIK